MSDSFTNKEDAATPHIDYMETLKNYMNNIDPNTLNKYIGETKDLLSSQSDIMDTFKSMKPMMSQVSEMMSNFKDTFGII